MGTNPEDTAYIEEIPVRPEDLPPPTLFVTTAVTEPYLLLVEKYGVARYKEVNPALFAMAMFSFQFGIMFGDILHGGLLLLAAILMIVYETQLRVHPNEIVRMIVASRYMILLCAICATYMGLLYNEVASLPIDIFGTSYAPQYKTGDTTYYKFDGMPYIIGVDPKWRWSSNHVMFTNSLKMKMSVIIGILQMSFGVCLKLSNALHGCVGDRKTAIHESIPELVIYCFPFLYLIFIIIVKWYTDWENVHQGLRGPPSILNTLVNMAAFGEVTQKDVLLWPETCAVQMDPQTQADTGLGFCAYQTRFQRGLIGCVVICVPWLLLGIIT